MNFMQKTTFILLLSLIFISGYATADTKKIVKWVDSSGVTHYGDKLPSQELGRNNTEMRDSGIVIKRNIKADQKTEVLDLQKQQQKLDQDRKDKVLLASYTKPEEIDLARDRNLETDFAAVQALTQQKQNTANRTLRNNKTAQGFKTKNKPLPAYLSEELKQSQLEFDSINKQIAQRKANMEVTRKRYAEEKLRFIALKQPIVNATDSTVAATPIANLSAASLNGEAIPATSTNNVAK